MNDPQGLKDWAYTAFGPRLGRIVYVALVPLVAVFLLGIALATLWLNRSPPPAEVPLSKRLESSVASSSSVGQTARPAIQAERSEGITASPEVTVRTSESAPSPRSGELLEPVQTEQPSSPQNCTVNGGTNNGSMVLDCSR